MNKKFITFEGGDGSGKTTVINKIKEHLTKKGYDVVLTREPGGNKIAEQIRNIILDNENSMMDDRTEALLYAASRRQHVAETILPNLGAGKIVLCDRFIDSSLAYQGFARGLGIENVYEMNKFATDGVLPGITIYVRVSPEVADKRIHSNRKSLDRLEVESNNFKQKVFEGYEIISKKYSDRIKTVNGELSEEEVYQQAIQLINKYLGI